MSTNTNSLFPRNDFSNAAEDTFSALSREEIEILFRAARRQNAALLAENETLKSKNLILSQENVELRSKNIGLEEKNIKLNGLNEEQAILNTLDDRTGVYTPSYFYQQGGSFFIDQKKLEETGEDIKPYCVAIVDIDWLKQLNDTEGHYAGDQLICAVSSKIQNMFREGTDIIARIGGDEFGILIPETSQDIVEDRLKALEVQDHFYNSKSSR